MVKNQKTCITVILYDSYIMAKPQSPKMKKALIQAKTRQ